MLKFLPGSLQSWFQTHHHRGAFPFRQRAASPNHPHDNQRYSSDRHRKRSNPDSNYKAVILPNKIKLQIVKYAEILFFKSAESVLPLGWASWVLGFWDSGRMEGARTSAWRSTREEAPCGHSGKEEEISDPGTELNSDLSKVFSFAEWTFLPLI